MKKIIAAALSILVGAFGYTIVDKALENRVATLESEVAELRGYHSQADSSYSFVGERTTVKTYVSTTQQPSISQVAPVVGKVISESSDSIHKFLVREYYYSPSESGFEYIPPYRYEPISFVARPSEPEYTSKKVENYTIDNENEYTTATTAYDPSDGYTKGYDYPVAEYYVNLSECSAYISDIREEESYSYYYDNDYSQASKSIVSTNYYITIKYKGYTDPDLAGKNISFYVRLDGCGSNLKGKSAINSIINPDGSFEFEETYICNTLNPYDSFCISSVGIDN